MNIKEIKFEILNKVQVAMNNDNNEVRQMLTNIAHKKKIILQKIISTCNF